MSTRPQTKATAQEFLEIFDITNDLVILKDGTTSMILTVGAMNFGLLAEEEQDAVIYTYAALLNSLNFPIQIVIQSQTKDVTNYLNLLKQKEVESTSTQKRDRIARYRDFVTNLIQERNVLDKNFYVCIPATTIDLGLLTVDSIVPGKTEFDINKYEKPLIVDKAKTVLEPRRDHLISQFARIGLYSRQLTTQEIIKVFYTSYNSEASTGLDVANSNEYQTALVKASALPQTQELNLQNLATTTMPGNVVNNANLVQENFNEDFLPTEGIGENIDSQFIQNTQPVINQEQMPMQQPATTQPEPTQASQPEPIQPTQPTPITLPEPMEPPTATNTVSEELPTQPTAQPSQTNVVQENINEFEFTLPETASPTETATPLETPTPPTAPPTTQLETAPIPSVITPTAQPNLTQAPQLEPEQPTELPSEDPAQAIVNQELQKVGEVFNQDRPDTQADQDSDQNVQPPPIAEIQ